MRRCPRPSTRRITWICSSPRSRSDRTRCPGERVDVLEADVGPVLCTTVSHEARSGSPTGANADAKFFGAHVREDVEAIDLVVAVDEALHVVFDVVLDALLARATTRSSRFGVSASTNQTSVVSFDADVTMM